MAAQFGGGGDQRPGQGGAVPGALDEDGAAGVGLDTELVVAVVHDRGVAQRPGREVEAPGERLGAGAVVAEPAGLVAAGGGRCEDPGAGAAGVFAGPGHGQADREVRAAGLGVRRPGGGGDGGFQRPGDLAQRLALVVFALAVVALADVPAAVRVAGRQPGAPGRAAGEQRHRGGVQAGAAVEGGAFVLGEDRDAGLQQRVDQRLEPVPGRGGLIGGHRLGAGLELAGGQPPVFRQRRRVSGGHDRVEAVPDPAVGGQEGPRGAGGARHAEQPAACGRQLAEQQPGDLGQEQRPVIQRQAQQRGEHGAHRQRPGPPGAAGQRRLDDRGLPAAVDQPGGKRHGLLVRGAARPGDLQPAAVHAQPAAGLCPRPAARPWAGRRRRGVRSGPGTRPGRCR